MADSNAIKLTPSAWLPAAQWTLAPEATRARYLRRVGELVIFAKKSELRRGIGVDGKPLAKVLPRSRPDGATGKPLDPHFAESRSIRLLRVSIGSKGGTVTIHWSHGFGRILGYHADGLVRGAPVRDVIGLTDASEKTIRAEARRFWRAITGAGTPTAADVREMMRPAPVAPTPRPKAPTPARVVYLKPGETPKLRSKRIQVVGGTAAETKGEGADDPEGY